MGNVYQIKPIYNQVVSLYRNFKVLREDFIHVFDTWNIGQIDEVKTLLRNIKFCLDRRLQLYKKHPRGSTDLTILTQF